MKYLELFEKRFRPTIINLYLHQIRDGANTFDSVMDFVKQDLKRRKKWGLKDQYLIVYKNLDHPDLPAFVEHYLNYEKLDDEQKKDYKKLNQKISKKKRELRDFINERRPLSWSAISAFEYNKEEFFDRYILGKKTEGNAKMLFGNEIGRKLENDQTFFAKEIPRYPVYEKKLYARIGDINLVGLLDNYDPKTHAFHEFKTSSSKIRWTQKKAEEHGQLEFYFFLIWMNYQIPPEQVKCRLFYIPCEETGDFGMKLSDEPIQSFEVKKTVQDILNFGVRVKKVYQEMCTYVQNHA